MATSTPVPTPTPAAALAASAAPAKSAKPASAPKSSPAAAAKSAKAVAKPAARKAPVAKKTAAAKPAKASDLVQAKDVKAKKPKLVRDSFTIPKDEYAVIEALKQRASALAQPVKKSELLRAGLKVLASLSDNTLRTALQAVPSIKTGRPKAEPAETAKAATTKRVVKTTRK